MKITGTGLNGVVVIEPQVFGDERGWFMETYHLARLQEYGLKINFVQDNHSYSAAKGTLRGLHYQLNPKAQAKLVRCTRGAIFDVAVDIRRGSPTYAQWFGLELSADNRKQLFIPRGFAHGFITLTEDAEVQYKVDEYYAPACDRSIRWNDPDINITWPADTPPILSAKDAAAPLLRDADHNFTYAD